MAQRERDAIPITATQVFFGVCSLVGLAAVGWASAHVTDGASFLREVSGSWGARTISLDLVLLALPVIGFAVIESRRLGMRWPFIWIPLALPIPGACLVPLFLLLRERALLRRAAR